MQESLLLSDITNINPSHLRFKSVFNESSRAHSTLEGASNIYESKFNFVTIFSSLFLMIYTLKLTRRPAHSKSHVTRQFFRPIYRTGIINRSVFSNNLIIQSNNDYNPVSQENCENNITTDFLTSSQILISLLSSLGILSNRKPEISYSSILVDSGLLQKLCSIIKQKIIYHWDPGYFVEYMQFIIFFLIYKSYLSFP